MRSVKFIAAGAALVFASVSVSGAGASAGANRALTVYSVATGLQYINTADDRARGKINNPLGSVADKLAPKSAGSGNGPFAGDVAIYALSLYSSATLKQRAGSAVYTCYFNYDRHAFCQAYYTLTAGSTLVASGPIDFNATGFTIVVTGGTKKYLGVRGEASVGAAARHSQRIDFELLG
ncbi:MAG: hypothetical protein JOY73_11745 [Actinobacteria bacterium]|nr:hypothetical protein [Actinomycetota bacterium]